MTTFNSITSASVSATATTSWVFGPNAYMLAVAVTTAVMSASVARSGGALERDGIMDAEAATSMTAAASVKQGASAAMVATTSMSVAAGDGAVGFMLPLQGLSGAGDYAGSNIPPGLLAGGNGDFEPGEAGSYLGPLTGEAYDNLVTPFYAYADSSLLPLLGEGHSLTGQVTVGDTTNTLHAMHGLSGAGDYAGTTLPGGLEPGGDGSFEPGEAGSYMHPLVGLASDEVEPPVDNGDGTFTHTAFVSEALYVQHPRLGVGVYAVLVEDSLEVTDTVTPGVVRVVIISESLTASDTITPTASLVVALTEVLHIQSALSRTEYATWVMNARTEANSMYDGFEFDSLVTWRGRTLAAGPDGLFDLTGDDDDGTPIIASVLFDKTDFGTGVRKGMEGAYVGGYLPDGMHFKVTTDDGRTRTYEVKQTPRLATRRVGLGKGLLSRYYQGELTNPDGQDFTLDTIELVPVMTKRRR